MKIELRLDGTLQTDGGDLPIGRTFALLDAIARRHSVRAAAEDLSLSYRAAWGHVAALQAAIGQPLVTKTKGHGSALTPFGAELRRALGDAMARCEPPLAREQRTLERRLGELLGPQPRVLRISASHDPVLLAIVAGRADVEISVVGTANALQRLMQGDADVAGCHFGPTRPGERPDALRELDVVAHVAYPREQGLIVARGNPLRLRTIKDLATRQARFVNRQRGSGTRAWFDRMLQADGIAPDAIRGYAVEEFTHQAVAALVASGAADAALGVRTAAESFGVDFIPLGTETYYLLRRPDFRSPVLDDIAEALRSRASAA